MNLNLLDLNDDCLALIFTELDLWSSEQLRHVCRRFEHVICTLCSRNYRNWSSKIATDFTWLAENMTNAVEHLELHDATEKHFQLLQHQRFNHCKSLAINLILNEQNETSNGQIPSTTERTKIVVNSFPNLNQLLIVGVESLHTLYALNELEELSLRIHCMFDDIQHFSEMFKRFKLRKLNVECNTPYIFPKADFGTLTDCETLEEIALTGELMNIVLKRLLDLKRLKKIACIHTPGSDLIDRSNYYSFDRQFGHRITTLCSYKLFPTLRMDNFSMPNLRKLFVHDKFMYCYEPEEMECDLSALIELHFLNTDCRFMVKHSSYMEDPAYYHGEFHFLDILETCRNLQLLVVPYAWLNTKLKLKSLLSLLNWQPNRNTQLELRCLVDASEKDATELQIKQLLIEIKSSERKNKSSKGRNKSSKRKNNSPKGILWLKCISVSTFPNDERAYDWSRLNNYGFQIELD